MVEFRAIRIYDLAIAMRRLLNKLPIAWLILALIVAPVQAAAAPFVNSSEGSCPSRDGHAGTTVMHHQLAQDIEEPASQHCPQCADHGCNDGMCDDASCCASHIPPSVAVTALTIGIQPVLAVYTEHSETSDSLPPTPLYRPPV